jgi:hypothetical protein
MAFPSFAVPGTEVAYRPSSSAFYQSVTAPRDGEHGVVAPGPNSRAWRAGPRGGIVWVRWESGREVGVDAEDLVQVGAAAARPTTHASARVDVEDDERGLHVTTTVGGVVGSIKVEYPRGLKDAEQVAMDAAAELALSQRARRVEVYVRGRRRYVVTLEQ